MNTNSLLIVFMFFLSPLNANKSLKLMAQWQQLEFHFPSETIRDNAIITGEYIPANPVPIDTDVFYGPSGIDTIVFVTIPRFGNGVPITLGTISTETTTNGPVIAPYPNYTWHEHPGTNCNGLTSVFRIAIDECQRLWVLDTGAIGDNQVCPAKIVVFDLITNEVVHRFRFTDNLIRRPGSLFITPVIDVRDPPPGNCANTMVYIADVTGFAIIVYDMTQQKAWRTTNKYDYPHPHFGTFHIEKENFDLMDGVFGMAASPRQASIRHLYFHPLASATEYKVPLKVLDNYTAWQANSNFEPRSFTEIGARGTQATAQAMDKLGNLFFGLINPVGIGCWNIKNSYNRDNIKVVAENEKSLQFVSGLKIVTNKNGKDELWALSCRFQKVMTGTLSSSEVNFRIMTLPTETLMEGKECNTGRNDNSKISFIKK